MRHYDDPYRRGYPMTPEWGRPHPLDPNWADGEYHGNRMRAQPGHGAYGFHRQVHEHDLQGYVQQVKLWGVYPDELVRRARRQLFNPIKRTE